MPVTHKRRSAATETPDVGRPRFFPSEGKRSVSLTIRVPPSLREKLDSEYRRRDDVDSVSQLVTTILLEHFKKPNDDKNKK